ncbi:hypothetical protein P3W55_16785 [Pseudomonas citronellolis]|uniref:Phage tail protein n=1 Tax=Pseudomonas citronellolis TaxID=53408 RepID=A0AAW6PAN7_9PSED|nr:hypothetical protein [Pseudomonas citronellolis]MDF3843371.1 hypothetical protein [Pseudomonas citronellolis]
MELKNYFVQNANGDILPGATAALYLPGTTSLVSDLKDSDGAALANPFAATADGLLQFAAPNGTYDLTVSTPGRSYTVRIQCNDVAESVSAVQSAAAAAQASSQLAQDSADLAKLQKNYATYAEAMADVWNLPDGGIVRVLADETRGGRSAWYRTLIPSGESLVLDFIAGAYSVAESPLVFIKSQDLRLVSVPATSTSAGTPGDVALSTTYLYVAVATNTWRRVALSTF